MRTTGALKIATVIAALGSVAVFATRASVRGQAPGAATSNWALHNVDLQNSRYAPFDDINAGNVGSLVEKWRYDAPAADNVGRITPLVVDGIMYFNGGSKLFALDAATGKELWVTQVDPPFPASGRGPAYGDGRIYAFGRTILYAVDAKTGRVVESFGNKGRLQRRRSSARRSKYPDKDADRLLRSRRRPRTTTGRCTSGWRCRRRTSPAA